MNIKKMIAGGLMVMTGINMMHAELLDSSRPDEMFNVGVRIGMNSSVRTIKGGTFNYYQHNSWGNGFEAGAVANIKFRDWIAIQPGFFYQCRSGNYTYVDLVTQNLLDPTQSDENIQYGHYRRHLGLVPIMVSVRLSLSSDVKWLIEAGPYFQFSLGESSDDFYVGYGRANEYKPKANGGDFGFKMGTGIQFLKHYFAGVYYWAGTKDAWKNRLGGKNKAWSFTVGYDF